MALIRFYLGVEPKSLDEFYKLWFELEFALEFDGKLKKKSIKVV